MVLSSAGCNGPETTAEPQSRVARIGVPEADVTGPDIGLGQISALLTLEGLTTQNTDGRARPRLAERWVASSDGLTWRFHLQKGITFHDGTPATAPLVVEALRVAIARSSGRRPGLADVTGIEASGPSEITITLRRRSTFLLDDLDVEIARPVPGGAPVGTGAFKAVSQAAGPEITFDAHEKYHHGRPQLDRVTVRAYPTLRTAWASMMRQEIDVLWDLARDAVEFAGSRDVALYTYLRQYVHLIAFNSARPKFARTPIRRALNAAIYRDGLIRDVLRGQGQAANGPLWPQHWAYDSSLQGYVYDPSLASTTLDAAGVKPVRDPNGRLVRLSFSCILPTNRPILERLALNVQKQLYDVGVDMQLQPVSAEEYNNRIRASDFDAVMIEMLSGPFLSRPYVFWRWGGEQTAMNVFGYRSAAADRWFDAIRSAPSDAEYRVAAAQLQRALLDDPPALFLAWSQRTRAVSRRFTVPVDPNRDPMPSFWRWTVNESNRTTP